MPEILEFENIPKVFEENHIQPFREEYIPGSIVLCQEGSKGEEVFFQIPRPVALTLSESDLEGLKKQVHAWWKIKQEAA